MKLKKGYNPYSLEGKIETKLNNLKKYIIKKEIILDCWSVRHAKYISFGKYNFSDDWHELHIGDFWAKGGETAFIKKSVFLENVQNEYIGLYLDTDGEGLLYINGEPFHGVDNWRGYITLCRKAQQNETFDFMIEHKAGGYEVFEESAEKYIFKNAKLLFIDKDCESVYYDYLVPFDTALHLKDSIIQKLTLNLIYDSLLSIDWSQNKEEVRTELLKENKKYKEKLKTLPKGAGKVYFIGNSHIDLVFMWPERETHRKVGRTFNTLCRLMEEYDNYYFVCSQVPIYEYLKKYYSKTYKRILELIKAGRFEPVGGTYVQNDTNLISGESHIRQCLYGQRFFEKEFGKRAEIGWLPDCFGFAYTLPQIYKQAGLKYLFTQKMRYNEQNSFEEENNFPELYFIWEGPDGSRIPVYNSGSYKHLTYDYMDYMMFNIDYYYNKVRHLPMPDYLAPYGYGDGGGGPSRKALEYIKRLGECPGFPAVRVGSVREFFDSLPKDGLTKYSNEIYLEAHRGTYTTQSRIKKNNRKAEISVRGAEILSVLADNYNRKKLTELWHKILFNQFHDILPGSCINEGVSDAQKQGEAVLSQLGDISDTNLKIIADRQKTDGDGKPVFVFNTLSFGREETVSAAAEEECTVFDSEGKEVPSQYCEGHIIWTAKAEGFCGNIYYIREKNAHREADILINDNIIENKYYIIKIGEDGYISQIYDKEGQRDILTGRGGIFEVFDDRPEKFDAWDIEESFEQHKKEFVCTQKPHLCETGPARSVFESVYKYNNSVINQKMILYSHTKRIDFIAECDWHEEHILLKTAFETDIRTNEAVYEIPYGSIKRSTKRGTVHEKAKFEVSGHRWADISEPLYGVSLLSDCKYGWDIQNGKMRLSLLRSPKHPDRSADMGRHKWTFSLFPHKGCGLWETIKEAHSLNNPLSVTLPKKHDGCDCAPFVLTDGNVIIDCIKKAEDSEDIILRLYEPLGSRQKICLKFNRNLIYAKETNILEDETGECKFEENRLCFCIKPFEIKTFKIRF